MGFTKEGTKSILKVTSFFFDMEQASLVVDRTLNRYFVGEKAAWIVTRLSTVTLS